MKVIEITVKFSVKTEEEGQRIMSVLGVAGDPIKVIVPDAVKKSVEPYTPLSERTRMALEALKKCTRVSVLREEVLEVWANAYPHANLAGEIAKCEAWAESKGVTRTPRGWQKALNSWLSKAQDSTQGNTYNHTITNKVAAPVVVEAETEAWLKAAA